MLIMLALLSVWPRWPPSPAGIGVGSEVSGEEFDSNLAATSRLQTHRNEWNRWDSDCGGRNILWGTQQGHLPGAMWWLRRFYTVAFVCLFHLGSLPGGAAGQPSVVIYLISSFTTLSLRSLIPIFSSSFLFCCCCPRNPPLSLRAAAHVDSVLSLLSTNPRSNRLWLPDFHSALSLSLFAMGQRL